MDQFDGLQSKCGSPWFVSPDAGIVMLELMSGGEERVCGEPGRNSLDVLDQRARHIARARWLIEGGMYALRLFHQA